jgi:energy-coupling factor transporter transmembrane protein EcfT
MKIPQGSLFTLAAGKSPARRWDPRHKLLALSLLGASILAAPWPLLPLPMGFLLVAYLTAGVSIRQALRAARWFLFLLILVTVTRGSRILSIVPFALQLSAAGAVEGALIGGRILGVALAGHLYTAVTPRGDTVRTLEWAARPILGGRRSADLGLVVGLSLSIVPLVFRSVYDASVALTARGLPEGRRLRRLSLVSSTAIVSLLRRSDAMAQALVARGYTGENRSVAFRGFLRGLAVSAPALLVFVVVMVLR